MIRFRRKIPTQPTAPAWPPPDKVRTRKIDYLHHIAAHSEDAAHRLAAIQEAATDQTLAIAELTQAVKALTAEVAAARTVAMDSAVRS